MRSDLLSCLAVSLCGTSCSPSMPTQTRLCAPVSAYVTSATVVHVHTSFDGVTGCVCAHAAVAKEASPFVVWAHGLHVQAWK